MAKMLCFNVTAMPQENGTPGSAWGEPKQMTPEVLEADLSAPTRRQLQLKEDTHVLVVDESTGGHEILTIREVRKSLFDGFCYERASPRVPKSGAVKRRLSFDAANAMMHAATQKVLDDIDKVIADLECILH
jgi:hypothetical protein